MITNEGRDGQFARRCRYRASCRAVAFPAGLHTCLTTRADELCELADAVLCADGPVRTLAGLSLAPEHRRGHGALYDAVNHGRMDVARLRRSLAGLPLPRAADGRLVLAADVSNWLRPGAATSPDRLFCHVLWPREGPGADDPGLAVLGDRGAGAGLDAVSLGPDDDETAVTAAQVREVGTRLIEAGHWREGDRPILMVFDAGYDVTRLANVLADLPVELLGRLRSDRVMQLPAPRASPALWAAPASTAASWPSLTRRRGRLRRSPRAR
jgi:hypothetical protein